jgi:hypothetical protein
LAAWPVMAVRRRAGVRVLTGAFAVPATAVMLGLLTWFTLEIHGSHRGLAERAAALAEVLWPLVVVVGAGATPRLRRRSRLTPIGSAPAA